MRITLLVAALVSFAPLALAQEQTEPVALTIYNQNFAVARTSIGLDLHAGINEITTAGVTSRLEPDSVVLRDPTGKRAIHVLEQNYDSAVVSQQWLLQKYEGKTIDFQLSPGTVFQGKIIRAGGVRPPEYSPDGQYFGGSSTEPLIEVNGKLQFTLPGLPIFPATTDGLLLKPTLRWQIQADRPDRYTAELAYITGGFDWEANYNIVVPESTDVTGDERADVLGWVTIHNQSGTDFPQARIKLMAGDVAKLQPADHLRAMNQMISVSAGEVNAPQVTQKAFDDFHLYDLNRTVALRDGETKQVEFLDASAVTVRRTYIYDGAARVEPYCCGNVNEQQFYGLDDSNTSVAILEQIKNSASNHLGMPLPAGRVRLYRRDSDGQMEFVGESAIRHTPAEDTLALHTGSAFDVKGSRRQTDFHLDSSAHTVDEAFEITLTNQKQQPVNVNVIEHLYRGNNWQILSKSGEYTKSDSHTIEFPVAVPAKGEARLTYSVHYTW